MHQPLRRFLGLDTVLSVVTSAAMWGAAATAVAQPGGCGDPVSGSCYSPQPNPGCSQADCCDSVCNFDPFCCAVAWDLACVDSASFSCVPCPVCFGGAVAESEPCGANWNPGCDGGIFHPVFFGFELECETTVCGTLWADAGQVDSDWYWVVLPDPDGDGVTPVGLSFGVSLPAAVEVYTGFACAALTLQWSLALPPCDGISIPDVCLPAGLNLFRIVPTVSTGYPCSAVVPPEYAIAINYCGLSCDCDGDGIPDSAELDKDFDLIPDDCDACFHLCPSGSTDEGETCGQSMNDGCNGGPQLFGSISCGETICGTAWADGGDRDSDWFEIDLGSPQYLPCDIIVSIHAEFPAVIGVIDGNAGCIGAPFVAVANAPACAVTSLSVPHFGGTYWVFVAPDAFSGYPCSGPDVDYTITLTCGCSDCDEDSVPDSQEADPFCCHCICMHDSFCCSTSWDPICAAAAALACDKDCNGNGTMDTLDVILGASRDCNENCRPDECDPYCAWIGTPPGGYCAPSGCNLDFDCCTCVAMVDAFCCQVQWDDLCAGIASDICEKDCNGNGVFDTSDVLNGTSEDCNHNCIPDECEADTDGDGTIDSCDDCPLDPAKVEPGMCGCGYPDNLIGIWPDDDGDGCGDGSVPPGLICANVAPPLGMVTNGSDLCPNDPAKCAPGACGCGFPESFVSIWLDSDGDGCGDAGSAAGQHCANLPVPAGFAANGTDLCPTDAAKCGPGACGCGFPETFVSIWPDSDADGCGDAGSAAIQHCANLPVPTGYASNDTDQCPGDAAKCAPGACGCGFPESFVSIWLDSDGDGCGDAGTAAVQHCANLPVPPGYASNDTDLCPNDAAKCAPGACGCGFPEMFISIWPDSDGDGCGDAGSAAIQHCANLPVPTGYASNDTDQCPSDAAKCAPGACGCGFPESFVSIWLDSDGDGCGDAGSSAIQHCANLSVPAGYAPNNSDLCPSDPAKCAPGTCGCGNPDTTVTWHPDNDGDGKGDIGGTPITQCANLPAPTGTSTCGTGAVHAYVQNNLDGCDCDASKVAPGTCGCGNPDTLVTWYPDNDGDTFGSAAGAISQCAHLAPPPGHVGNDDDCDDSNPAIRPTAKEVCDCVDNNCNGQLDEQAAVCDLIPVGVNALGLMKQKALVVSGTATGASYSWRLKIEGPCDCTVLENLNETGVPAGGTAQALANDLIASIKAAATATGSACLVSTPPGMPCQVYLPASASLVNGNSQFNIRVGDQFADWTLWVGPPGNPSCEVMTLAGYQTAGLPICTFNPTIAEIEVSGLDCNGNDVDDTFDVASGDSPDLDGNGVPDECDNPACLRAVGSCFVAHEGGGCTNAACCGIVCSMMPACCAVAWDETCVEIAGQSCPSAGPCDLADHSCVEQGGPGCSGISCCLMVCGVDPACCEVAWDDLCVGQAIEECGKVAPCPNDADHPCEIAGSPGCTDQTCCVEVCTVDPFCCQVAWDQICVFEAAELCAAPGDLNGDGVVDGGDLGLLLGGWGTAGPGGDLDGNGVVDGADLGLLLGLWTP